MSGTTPPRRSPDAPPRGGYYWERRRAGALPWVIGAVGLLGLGIAYDVPLRHSIEDDLRTRSQEALAAAGAPGVDVSFTGRDGVLTGDLPPDVTAQDLVARVEAVDGVRVVRADLGSGGTAAPAPSASGSGGPSASSSASSSASASASSSASSSASASASASATAPPSVQVATADGAITLSGSVPSRESADALVAAATARFGQDRVTDRLTVDETVSDQGLTALGALLGALGPQDQVEVALADGRVTISGSVAAEATSTALEQAAARVTGDASRVTSQVTVVPGADDAKQRIEAALNAPRITFATGSTRLTPQGHEAVAEVARVLRDNPETLVRIEGFTDDIGSAESNQRLSTARASAVRDALHRLGIAHERMSYRGYGETRPLVPNTSEANRAQNRRVHFLVL